MRLNNRTLYLAICFFILVVGFTTEARSQVCQLTVNLRAEELEGVDGSAKVTLISTTVSKGSYWGLSKGSKSIFTNIPVGEYTLLARQRSYMTTVGKLRVECGKSINQRDVFVNITQCGGDQSDVFNEGAISTKVVDPNRFTVMGSVEFICRQEISDIPPIRKEIPKQISGGVVNGKALSLPRPPYPPAAKAVRAGGLVSVQVLIDENGTVVSASAISGHPLLRAAATAAALGARFSPTKLNGVSVKVSGVITYTFVAP